MARFAKEVRRQRLLVEGYFEIKVSRTTVQRYFTHILRVLKLKAYGKPIIFSPGGEGKKENQGYDAFIPLIDSGIALYVWSNRKFFSAVIYTCKSFSAKKATQATTTFFKSKKFMVKEF
ncbi:MAG: hypothetical protein HY053_05215 [Proteobacteria bacterium]|nr:hypothetical protein [Pseudomonadota bacterium]